MNNLTCIVCGSSFERRGARGPIPKYCSDACRAKAQRQKPERREYEREYRRRERALGKRKLYEFEYNRRPEVRARNRERMRIKWHTDPEYRAKQLLRWSDPHADVVIPQPYSDHRWFDMAHRAVNGGRPLPDPAFRDFGYNDEVGEALLALLEGRDMAEAVQDYRRREYVPRHLTLFWGEFRDEENEWREDKYVPQVESAEEEVLANEAVSLYLKTRYHHGSNGRPMHGGRRKQQPSRRRMKDGKSWMKHSGLSARAVYRE